MNIGLEFTTKKKQLYATFYSEEERDQFYSCLFKQIN